MNESIAKIIKVNNSTIIYNLFQSIITLTIGTVDTEQILLKCEILVALIYNIWYLVDVKYL